MSGRKSRYDASVRTTSFFFSASSAASSAAAFFRRFPFVFLTPSRLAFVPAARFFPSRVRGSGDGSSGAGTGGRAGGGGASSTTPPTNQVSKSSNPAVQSSSTWNSSLFPTATQMQIATSSGCFP